MSSTFSSNYRRQLDCTANSAQKYPLVKSFWQVIGIFLGKHVSFIKVILFIKVLLKFFDSFIC